MKTRLGDLLLDDEDITALMSWIRGLVEERNKARQQAEDEIARDIRDEAWHTKLTAIAESMADRHGPLEDMDAWEQAKAACASWEAQAGYFDVDEFFVMDDDWRETWHNAYSDRIEEIKRSRAS